MKNDKIIKIQQGDIIIKTTVLPKKQWGKKINHLILQKSDVSGHSHKIVGKAVLYSTDKEGEFFLDVLEKSKVLHEEHKTLSVPKGKYFVYGVRELDHFEEEIRRVRD
ncbi:MAG TPA: hypothetical protein PLU55_01570 [Candidatus Pacearchaeota archaeon]|nr:hypothetical protein [Candidatus Pacearchaeota archaeon]